MNLRKIDTVFTFLLLFCFACTSDSNSGEDGQGVDYQKLSVELCKCAQPSIVLNNEMQRLQESNRKSELKALFPRAGETFEKVLECTQSYIFSYTIKDVDGAKLQAAMQKDCLGIQRRMLGEVVRKVVEGSAGGEE